MTTDTVTRAEFEELKSSIDALKMGKVVKKDKIKRAPTAYNMFIGEAIVKIRKDNTDPKLTHKHFFSMAVDSWKKKKADDEAKK